MNVQEAAQQVVRNYPGGAVALGPLMGKASGSLSNSVAAGTRKRISLEDAVRLSKLAGSDLILQAFALALHHMVLPLPKSGEDATSKSVAKLTSRAAQRFGLLMAEVADDLDDGRVTDNELARLETEALAHVQAVSRMVAKFRAINAELRAQAPAAE